MNSRILTIEKALGIAYVAAILVVIPSVVMSGVFAMNGTTAGMLSCLAYVLLTIIGLTVLYQLAMRYLADNYLADNYHNRPVFNDRSRLDSWNVAKESDSQFA